MAELIDHALEDLSAGDIDGAGDVLQILRNFLTWECFPAQRLYDFEDFGPYFGEEPRDE